MLVLHAHWQPPGSPAETGGVLFWAETSDAPPPPLSRGRPARDPKPKEHPFCAAPQALERLSEWGIALEGASPGRATLRLPTARRGPQPSPHLLHDWEADEPAPSRLSPWRGHGAWLAVPQSLEALARLPQAQDLPPQVALAAEARFWRAAAGLALETLAAHKLVPGLVPADHGFHARWLPVLEGPQDASRLARLERAMPPICRADASLGEIPPSPRAILEAFLRTMCDALARRWGRIGAHKPRDDDPASSWLAALFDDDPTVDASPAQLQALAHGHRAWMRNLHPAGDAAFRVAFRLETPTTGKEVGAQTNEWWLHYLLQARDDPSLLVPADTVWKARKDVLRALGRRMDRPQEKLLSGLGYAARIFSPIAESMKSALPDRLALDTHQAYAFLRQAAPLLESAGFGLLAPPWWNRPGARLAARLRLKPTRGEGAVREGKLSFEDIVNFRWELSLGDTALTREEFEALVALKSPLVHIRGQWVQLDPAQIEAAIRFWEGNDPEGEIGLQEALRLGLGAEGAQDGLPVEGVQAEGWLAEWLNRFTGRETLEELPQPAGFQGELRPYQRYGYSWLWFLRRWGLGACLADDMGLGKTIQALALLLHEKEQRQGPKAPVLLVCPTSVVANWAHEARRFASGLSVLVHQGADRRREEAFAEAAGEVDLVLTSYPIVRRDIETMQSVRWLGVILDEAQNIKNPSAVQTQAVRRLSAGFRLALTGTPVENRLSELWSIMHFLNPGYLGSREEFRRRFALPIERYGDEGATGHLRRMVGPFILRRVKSDPRVIQDLPEKVEMSVYCNLTEEQATLYQAAVDEALRRVEDSEGMERRGLVLSMLTQLKQICNHPMHYLHQAEGPATETAELADRSGKLNRLTEMLEEALSAGDRVLIFTQYAEMGGLLRTYLPQALGCGTLFLHGRVPAGKRDEMVRRFQEEPHAPPVFVLSLKAGGTGLNLTRANRVFHFDRWWNPAVEDQATDRAFRIGQRRDVQVHKLITAGTLEETIDEMIAGKRALAQAVVGGGERWLTELSTDQLRELVRLRVEA